MEIKHIEEKVCAICKAEIISENIAGQHCNGEWNEYREFACGSILHYSPNFKAVVMHKICPEYPAIRNANRKLRKGIKELQEFMKTIDVEERFKQSIKLDSGKWTYDMGLITREWEVKV